MIFTKAQALGNDFIIIDGRKGEPAIDPGRAVALCDRRFGIGADGVLIVGASEEADISMKVINADGSFAEMCGNGVRCVALYARENGLAKDAMTVETGAGIKTVRFDVTNGGLQGIEVDIGEPSDVRPLELKVGDMTIQATALSMGNPHCVTFVNDTASVPVDKIGPVIERLPDFPNRTNAEFAHVISETEIAMRVWERGAGETSACGTGAAAVVAAAVINKLAQRSATVHLAGGDLDVAWKDDSHVYIKGSAELVFEGALL